MVRACPFMARRGPSDMIPMLPLRKGFGKANDCMNINPFAILSTDRLAAGRWFIAARLLCAVATLLIGASITNLCAATPFSDDNWTGLGGIPGENNVLTVRVDGSGNFKIVGDV